jgi:hypothetical protein
VSDRPLVSVITGCIPSRLDLLVELMANLREQTYPNIEHCIAFEGPCDAVDVAEARLCWAMGQPDGKLRVPFRTVGLGRWWSRYLAASESTVPFQTAQWMARGDYLMWAADDERFEPDHIAALVELLEATDSDFVYSKAELWAKDDPTFRMVIGRDPPLLGTITNALFRADLLDYRGFTPGVGSATDWDQISHWIAAGARWAMLDRVTLTHRLDKYGEGPDFRAERRPLRGHKERIA